jgi:hypothetical protein
MKFKPRITSSKKEKAKEGDGMSKNDKKRLGKKFTQTPLVQLRAPVFATLAIFKKRELS